MKRFTPRFWAERITHKCPAGQTLIATMKAKRCLAALVRAGFSGVYRLPSRKGAWVRRRNRAKYNCLGAQNGVVDQAMWGAEFLGRQAKAMRWKRCTAPAGLPRPMVIARGRRG